MSNSKAPSTNTSITEIAKPEWNPWVMSTTLTIYLVSCIILNATIFLVITLIRTYRNPANYLLANLCLASITVMLIGFLSMMQRDHEIFIYGTYSCIVTSAIHRIPFPLMGYSLMVLCVDRSRAARNPMLVSTKTVRMQIIFVWIASILMSIPRGLGAIFDPLIPGYYKCAKGPIANSYVLQAIVATIHFTMTALSPAVLISIELLKTRAQMRYLTSCEGIHGRSCGGRLRIMRNACIFTYFFMGSWLPLGILQFPLDCFPMWKFPSLFIRARDYFAYFVNLQTSINPLLVFALSFDCQDLFTSCVLTAI